MRLGRSVGCARWTVPVVAVEEMDSSDGFELIRSVAMTCGRAGASVGDSGKLALHVDVKGSGILGSCMISSETCSSKSVLRSAENRCFAEDDNAGVAIGLWSGAEEDPSKVEGVPMLDLLFTVLAMDLPFPFPVNFLPLANAVPGMILCETEASFSSNSDPCCW